MQKSLYKSTLVCNQSKTIEYLHKHKTKGLESSIYYVMTWCGWFSFLKRFFSFGWLHLELNSTLQFAFRKVSNNRISHNHQQWCGISNSIEQKQQNSSSSQHWCGQEIWRLSSASQPWSHCNFSQILLQNNKLKNILLHKKLI